MQFLLIQRILGLLLIFFSSSLLPPYFVGLYYQDGATEPFIQAFIVTLLCGSLLLFPVRNQKKELRLRDGFMVVVSPDIDSKTASVIDISLIPDK